MITQITDAEFDSVVLNSDIPVVVDFFAQWCGPCKAMLPILEELSNDYDGELKFVKVDIDDSQIAMERYHIRSIPTLLLIKNGEVVKAVVGGRPKSALQNEIQQLADME